MYCHNCGAHASTEQNFCRACGADLRSASATVSGYPPAWSEPRRLWQGVIDSVSEALRTGFKYVSEQPSSHMEPRTETSRLHRWGLIAFWAGLAALLADLTGVVLMLIGIGLMVHVRKSLGSRRNISASKMSATQTPSYTQPRTSSNPSPPPVAEPESSNSLRPRRPQTTAAINRD